MIVIDFLWLLDILLPYYGKSVQLTPFLTVVMNVMNQTQTNLQSLFSWFDYKTQFTGEVISLEYFLNNQYDATLRRIYIDTFDELSDVYFFNTSEGNEDVYLFNASEFSDPTGPVDELVDPEQVYLYQQQEVGTGAAFTVVLPIGLVYNQIQMKADIDYYRLAGKTYQIVEE